MKATFLYCVLILGSLLKVCAQPVSHRVCANDPRVKRYFVPNPDPNMTYTWALSGGGQVLPSASDTFYVNWGNTPGIYRVSLYASLNGACASDTARYNVEILPTPTLNIQGNGNVCEGAKVSLSASGAAQIAWSNLTTGPTADFYPTGPTRVWAIGFDGSCLSDTTFFDLTPIPLPVASFSASPLQGEAPLFVSFANTSQNGHTYAWDFGNGVVSQAQNPSTQYVLPGEYPVTLVTQNLAGCSDTTRFQFIVVNEAFAWFIPNTFTPTGDQINEVFKPYFKDFIEYTLSIFDRWGNLIYQSTGTDGAWNGKTIEHKDAAQDVYVYRIRFRAPNDKKEQIRTGSVTLLR